MWELVSYEGKKDKGKLKWPIEKKKKWAVDNIRLICPLRKIGKIREKKLFSHFIPGKVLDR